MLSHIFIPFYSISLNNKKLQAFPSLENSFSSTSRVVDFAEVNFYLDDCIIIYYIYLLFYFNLDIF